MKNIQVFTIIAGKIARFDGGVPSNEATVDMLADMRAEVAANTHERTAPVLALIFGGKDV